MDPHILERRRKRNGKTFIPRPSEYICVEPIGLSSVVRELGKFPGNKNSVSPPLHSYNLTGGLFQHSKGYARQIAIG